MPNTTNSCILTGAGCTSPTDLPEFIDTSACLCGLVPSRVPLANGGLEQKWRCIGNASADIEDDGNGKWYNTSLPSQELSGINQPQNWGENPPDTSKTFVLEDDHGKPVYVELGPQGSANLKGSDAQCTGQNDTELSVLYYGHDNSTSSSSVSSSASATSTSTSTSSMSASSVLSTSTASRAVETTSTATSSVSSPSASSSSAASLRQVKAIALIGMFLAPLIAGTA